MAANLEIKTIGRIVSKQFPEELLKQILKGVEDAQEYAIDTIIKRTKSGRNVYGHNMDAYTPSYKKWKAKNYPPASPVNLTMTGDMLNSLRGSVERTNNKVTAVIAVTDPDVVKVKSVSSYGNRQWFGISQEVRQVFERIRRSLNLNEANK